MNARQSILQVILIDFFIIANNNKQTENNFFQDVIYINISNAKTSCQYTATATISAYQLMTPSAVLGRSVTYPV